MCEEFNKLKRIRDLCSHEYSGYYSLDPNVDSSLYRQGRAEFAQSILELIGKTMNKKLGDIEEDYQSIFNEEEEEIIMKEETNEVVS